MRCQVQGSGSLRRSLSADANALRPWDQAVTVLLGFLLLLPKSGFQTTLPPRPPSYPERVLSPRVQTALPPHPPSYPEPEYDTTSHLFWSTINNSTNKYLTVVGRQTHRVKCLPWGLKDPESDLQKPHNNRAGWCWFEAAVLRSGNRWIVGLTGRPAWPA